MSESAGHELTQHGVQPVGDTVTGASEIAPATHPYPQYRYLVIAVHQR
jgi:hypothetical protein